MSSTGRRAGARGPPVHVPVLLERVTELLAPACAADGAVLVDATLGLAGHSLALLDAHPGLRLIGLDRDPEARAEAARRIEAAGSRRPRHPRARRLRRAARRARPPRHRRGPGRPVRPRRLLAAAGPARPRLQLLRRRPAGHADGPRPRRAPPPTSSTPTPPRELARVLRVYGEERFASRIAAAIERERAREPLHPHRAGWPSWCATSIPAATRRTGGHPAKRTFQALRIEVNDELGALERALPGGRRRARRRRPGRRHHLPLARGPDRQADPRRGRHRPHAAGACPCPLPEHGPVLRLLTRGGEAASDAEIAANPRAASARVRAAERIRRAA